MNNGRYMLQKIRGSPEINAVVGEAWSLKRSTDLRQYHKNYQRETWSRVLNLLRDDGVITVKGHVQKQVLKDRQRRHGRDPADAGGLGGQRRAAAAVGAPRLHRCRRRAGVPVLPGAVLAAVQHFTAGRQAEKYINLSGEDLEAIIEELFDGNAVSMPRRRT